jgi:sugar phosphate permease
MERSRTALILAPALVGAFVIGALFLAAKAYLPSHSGPDGLAYGAAFVIVGLPSVFLVSWVALAITTGVWRGPVVTAGGCLVVAALLNIFSQLSGVTAVPVVVAALLGAIGFALVATMFLPGLAAWERATVSALALGVGIWGWLAR